MATPIISPRIEPWKWNVSNVSADAWDTWYAWYALANNEEILNFKYTVWNDIVDKIRQARLSISDGWRGDYGTHENTKMTERLQPLTSDRFNACVHNIGWPWWDWEMVEGSHGYLGRTYIRGVAKHGSIQADNVRATYFFQLVDRLNLLLDVLNGDKERRQLTWAEDFRLSFVRNLVALPSAPLQNPNIWYGRLSYNATNHTFPSFPLILDFRAGKHNHSATMITQAGGLSAVDYWIWTNVQWDMTLLRARPMTSHLIIDEAFVTLTANFMYLPPVAFKAQAGGTDDLKYSATNVVLPPKPCEASLVLPPVESVAFLEKVATAPMTSRRIYDEDFNYLRYEMNMSYNVAFPLDTKEKTISKVSATIDVEKMVTWTERFDFFSTTKSAMHVGQSIEPTEIEIEYFYEISGTLNSNGALGLDYAFDMGHTVSGLLSTGKALPLAPQEVRIEFDSSLSGEITVLPVVPFEMIANVHFQHAFDRVAIQSIANVLGGFGANTTSTLRIDTFNMTTLDSAYFLPLGTVHEQYTQDASFSIAFTKDLVPIEAERQDHELDIDYSISYGEVLTMPKAGNDDKMKILATVEMKEKDWFPPIQTGKDLYIQQVWFVDSSETVLNLEQMKQASFEATNDIKLVMYETLELFAPEWRDPIKRGKELYVQQAWDARLYTKKDLEVD